MHLEWRYARLPLSKYVSAKFLLACRCRSWSWENAKTSLHAITVDVAFIWNRCCILVLVYYISEFGLLMWVKTFMYELNLCSSVVWTLIFKEYPRPKMSTSHGLGRRCPYRSCAYCILRMRSINFGRTQPTVQTDAGRTRQAPRARQRVVKSKHISCLRRHRYRAARATHTI